VSAKGNTKTPDPFKLREEAERLLEEIEQRGGLIDTEAAQVRAAHEALVAERATSARAEAGGQKVERSAEMITAELRTVAENLEALDVRRKAIEQAAREARREIGQVYRDHVEFFAAREGEPAAAEFRAAVAAVRAAVDEAQDAAGRANATWAPIREVLHERGLQIHSELYDVQGVLFSLRHMVEATGRPAGLQEREDGKLVDRAGLGVDGEHHGFVDVEKLPHATSTAA